VIEFKSATKQFGDGTLAVDDFSFTMASNQVTVLVGSSGCGKTTILRMINRMVEPTSGSVSIDGFDVNASDPVALRRSIGYVLQAGGLLPHRTVADNVATVPVLRGAKRREARIAAVDLLVKVGLDPSVATKYPRQLSGGQQQRVGVARALAGDPNILLMDEPFGAVDPIVRADLQVELRRLQSELAKTVVFVTHDIDEAFALADQIVILRAGGRIAQAGTPAEVMANPANDFVASFLGLNRGERILRRSPQPNGTTLLIDADDRPVGYLADSDAAAGSATDSDPFRARAATVLALHQKARLVR
jgi:osmoprotectant transport system ATP-binding protein